MAKKDDASLITIGDEFRRAKLASLTWSSLTCVAALGTPKDGQSQTSVSFFATQLTYDQPLLVALFFIAASFYFGGFWRANTRLKFRNNRLIGEAGGDWDQVDQIAGSLKDDIDHMSRVVRTGVANAERINALVEGVRRQADRLEKRVATEIDRDNLAATQARFAELASATTSSTPELQRLVKQVAAQSDSNYSRADAGIKEFRQEIGKLLKDFEHLPDSMSTTIDYIGRIAKLQSDLREFRSTIGAGERRWYYTYDVAPIIALFIGASIGFILRTLPVVV